MADPTAPVELREPFAYDEIVPLEVESSVDNVAPPIDWLYNFPPREPLGSIKPASAPPGPWL